MTSGSRSSTASAPAARGPARSETRTQEIADQSAVHRLARARGARPRADAVHQAAAIVDALGSTVAQAERLLAHGREGLRAGRQDADRRGRRAAEPDLGAAPGLARGRRDLLVARVNLRLADRVAGPAAERYRQPEDRPSGPCSVPSGGRPETPALRQDLSDALILGRDRLDVVVIGAGASGLMCAATAGARGRSVLVLDHAPQAGAKIRISGGGRCNFTNREVSAPDYRSGNPRFCTSALARFTPRTPRPARRHGVRWPEREEGQLFCDESARQVVDLLLAECARGGARVRRGLPRAASEAATRLRRPRRLRGAPCAPPRSWSPPAASPTRSSARAASASISRASSAWRWPRRAPRSSRSSSPGRTASPSRRLPASPRSLDPLRRARVRRQGPLHAPRPERAGGAPGLAPLGAGGAAPRRPAPGDGPARPLLVEAREPRRAEDRPRRTAPPATRRAALRTTGRCAAR